jgi:hypothetical protein
MTESIHSVPSKRLKELVAFGKKCSRTAFPNPKREGCPGHASLRAMANRDQRLTLEDLPISHVVRCSPCFQEYLRLRKMSLFMRGLQITAASLVAIAVFVTAIRFVQNYSNSRGAPSIAEQRRSQPQTSISSPQPSLARLPITIDLAVFSPTRGDEKKESKESIHLPRRPLRVTLQMPFGMEPGAYAVRLEDSAGNVYADTRVAGRISDGTTALDVDVDLTATSPRNLSLMIQPRGLRWRSYPVVVE